MRITPRGRLVSDRLRCVGAAFHEGFAHYLKVWKRWSGRKRERHGGVKEMKWMRVIKAGGRGRELKVLPAGQCHGPFAAASGRRCQSAHPAGIEPRGRIGRLPRRGLPRRPRPAKCRGRLHRGVFCAGKSMITVRAAPPWWCATGERGSRPRRRRPAGPPDGLRHRLRLDAAETSSPRFSWRRCGGWEALSAHRRGRPRALPANTTGSAWPASGPPPGARRAAHAPWRRGGAAGPKAPRRPWKRPRTRPPANAASRGRGRPLPCVFHAGGRRPCACSPGLRSPCLWRCRGSGAPDLHRLARRHHGGHNKHFCARQGRHGRCARGHHRRPAAQGLSPAMLRPSAALHAGGGSGRHMSRALTDIFGASRRGSHHLPSLTPSAPVASMGAGGTPLADVLPPSLNPHGKLNFPYQAPQCTAPRSLLTGVNSESRHTRHYSLILR